jgi:DNA primase
MLKNFARRIVLAYDADAAGQAAAERFYEWERRYEVDVAVAALPPGSDPGDLARRDPAALEKAVAEATPFLAFRLERVLGAADLRAPEGRARAAEAALAVIAEHPSELVRDQYLMQVADRCRVDPDRLRRGVTPPRPDGDGGGRARPARRREPGGPELEALRLTVHRRGEVVERLHPVLFADERNLAAFSALAAAPTVHDAIAAAPPEAADLLQRLAVEEASADPDDVVSRLVDRAAHRALVELEAEARAAPEQALAVSATVAWLQLTLADLPSADAADRLVAWLVQWAEEEA